MGKFKDIDNEMQTHDAGSGFQFSGAKIENLGASEYTLGVIIVDGSGSVSPFWDGIKKALRTVVEACRKNPRADNMMLRLVVFDHLVREVHGFKPLCDINDVDYDSLDLPGNTTALFDATYSGVRSAAEYGRLLVAQQYSVNAAVFVITDGADNVSKTSMKMVADVIQDARTSESLESIMPVLIGVNVDQNTGLNSYLEDFRDKAGFQQYVAIDKATPQNLAKLGGFVSQSISSQSKALGTGGASKSLSF